MASPLVWKVYNANEHVASLKYAEDAALVVANTEHGVVRVDGRVVWRETLDGPAGNSYDQAAQVMAARRRQNHAQRYAQVAQVQP